MSSLKSCVEQDLFADNRLKKAIKSTFGEILVARYDLLINSTLKIDHSRAKTVRHTKCTLTRIHYDTCRNMHAWSVIVLLLTAKCVLSPVRLTTWW